MPTRLRDPLHIFALWGLAVAQPIFDLLVRTPEFFVLRGLETLDILLLAAGLGVVVPGALGWLATLPPERWRRFTVGALVGLLGALLALQLLRVVAAPLVAVALALVLGAGLAAVRERGMGEWLSWLGVLVLLVPVVFVVRAPLGAVSGLGGETLEVSASHPRSVVLVILDELPLVSLLDAEGEIDGILFPHFAELAASSTWFPNATAVASVTEQAVPAILSGERPRPGVLPTVEGHPRNLFTLLAGTHDFHVHEPRTRLCPPERRSTRRALFVERFALLASDLAVVSLHLMAPPAWRERLPEISRSWQGFGARLEESRAGEADDFRAFVEQLPAAGERPRLVVLHSLLPHSPWIHLPSGRRYPARAGALERRGFTVGRWADSPWTVIQAQQRHLLQTRFTDKLLGELLEGLRARGLWDDALVIITADHGISFRQGEWVRDASPANFVDIANVPLFVKAPGQAAARVDERAASAVDLLPTVVDVLGLAAPGAGLSFDGASLLGAAGESEAKVYNGPASTVRADPSALPSARRAAARRQAAIFRSTGDPDSLFRIGPLRDVLIGRPVDELNVREGSPWTAQLDHAEDYAALDLAAPTLPARVTGRWTGPLGDEPVALALAVRGRVEAITLALPPDGDFSAMVREAAWRDGDNPPALYRLAPGTDGPTLEPVALRPPVRWTVDGDTLLATTGESWALREGAAGAAWIVRSAEVGVRVEIVGWSEHPESGAAPERFVLVAADGRFVFAGPPSLRGDLRRRYQLPGLTAERAGFAWSVPVEDLPVEESAAASGRVFALYGDGTAWPLEVEEIEARDVPPEWG